MPYAERREADKRHHMVTVSVRLSTEDHDIFAAEAKKELRSFSNMIVVLAKRGLKASNESV